MRASPFVAGLARLECRARCEGTTEREHELTVDRHGTVRARCLGCGGTEGYAMGMATADPELRSYREGSA